MTNRARDRSRVLMFGLAASAMFAAALYHSVAVVIPAFGRYAYPSTYPLWRHVVFIAINVTLGSMLIARSNFLLWAFVLLTAQIYAGHGQLVGRLNSRRSHRVD